MAKADKIHRKAVVLLSGGLDSTTVLAHAIAAGVPPDNISALTFDYSQRHAIELSSAAMVASALGVKDHVVVRLDLSFAHSALLGSEDVPKHRSLEEIGHENLVPVTYVPARNTLFLSYALALAESRGAREIHIGVNALDYSGYPDCRPDFLAAFETMANLGTASGMGGHGVGLVAPLVHLTKEDIVRMAIQVGAPLALTHSCYDPGPTGEPCAACDSCLLRAKGFAAAGVPDPALFGRPKP